MTSPVFNIQGVDFGKEGSDNASIFFPEYNEKNGIPLELYESEPEDYIFNKEYMTNSKGVVKFCGGVLSQICLTSSVL